MSSSAEGRRATLVASLTRPPSDDGGELAALAGVADWLEVRADLTGDLEPAALRERFPGGLLYTLRSRAEGGRGPDSPAERGERLAAAAAGYDLVDLEGERDHGPELLAAVAAERRLVSWHGAAADLAGLQQRFARLSEIPARLYKLVPAANRPGEELPPLLLLDALGRRDVVAFASGPQAAWARLVAPRLGAPWIYAAAGDQPAAPGQPTLAALVGDYGLPLLSPARALCGVVGNPVGHSLSPRLHNGAYRELGLPLLFVAFEPDSFGDFWLEVVESEVPAAVGLPLIGLAITAPFKRAALAVAGATSPLAERVVAANTLVLDQGVWEAECTDPDGVALPLARRGVELAGLPAAVIGAGGAGRAAAFALARAGALVTLVNRGAERGRAAADELRLPFEPLDGFTPERFRLLVNATPVGGDQTPVPLARLAPGTAVVELAYGAGDTALLGAARAAGGVTVDGREVLLYQALAQFRLMTGRELPPAVGARLLGLEPPAAGAGGEA